MSAMGRPERELRSLWEQRSGEAEAWGFHDR